jgi:hypothetical protein
VQGKYCIPVCSLLNPTGELIENLTTGCCNEQTFGVKVELSERRAESRE